MSTGDVIPFSVLKDHMGNLAVFRTKIGHLYGDPKINLYLIQGVPSTDEASEAPKWIVHYRGEFTYCAPQLFELLWETCTEEILGQVLKDGSLFTLDTMKVISDNPTLKKKLLGKGETRRKRIKSDKEKNTSYPNPKKRRLTTIPNNSDNMPNLSVLSSLPKKEEGHDHSYSKT